MPATSSLQKRYTVGSCTLEVNWQLSALSRWYPQPVAQELHFKLWTTDEQGDASAASSEASSEASLVLVAEGDRATLQTIAQYISQQVRGILAAAPLSGRIMPLRELRERDRSTTLQLPPIPPSLQLTQPLSYLLLCDLNSVLHQCEQATSTLPIALSTSPLTLLESKPNAPKASNVIPFIALRRSIRRQPVAWASSAAAALLAVGLTTTLWPSTSYQISSEPSATADQEPDFSNADRAQPLPNPDLYTMAPDAGTAVKPNFDPAAPSNPSPNTSANSIKPATPSSNLEPSLEPSLEPRRPNTSTAATAERSPSQTEAPVRSLVKPTAKAPPPDPETAVSPPVPAERRDTLPQASQNEPESFSAAERASAPAVSSAPEAASSSAPESINSQRDLRRAPDADAAASGADSSSTVDSARLLEPRAIAQIQRYFEAKWQENGLALSEPLRYSLQLSTAGEVVSFTALSSAAETYRDRLISSEQPLKFSLEGAAERMTVQINILPSGQVQVFRR
ncbi:MAG: hypothetical protein WBA76_18515 [Phormidesmis sp.]